MIEASCPNHGHLVGHAYKDCGLLRRFLSGSNKKEEYKRKTDGAS